jgi:hypothetical protein
MIRRNSGRASLDRWNCGGAREVEKQHGIGSTRKLTATEIAAATGPGYGLNGRARGDEALLRENAKRRFRN